MGPRGCPSRAGGVSGKAQLQERSGKVTGSQATETPGAGGGCVSLRADAHVSRRAELKAAREQIQHVDLIWVLILNNL